MQRCVCVSQEDSRRDEFVSKIESLMLQLTQHALVDEALDQMALENVHSSLPPCLTRGKAQFVTTAHCIAVCVNVYS